MIPFTKQEKKVGLVLLVFASVFLFGFFKTNSTLLLFLSAYIYGEVCGIAVVVMKLRKKGIPAEVMRK